MINEEPDLEKLLEVLIEPRQLEKKSGFISKAYSLITGFWHSIFTYGGWNLYPELFGAYGSDYKTYSDLQPEENTIITQIHNIPPFNFKQFKKDFEKYKQKKRLNSCTNRYFEDA